MRDVRGMRDVRDIPERKLTINPKHKRSLPTKPDSTEVRNSFIAKKKTITGNLVPVRHRESRITTESQKFVDYTTVFGDTLHGLSIRFFGKPDFYLDIYLANKELFKNPSTVPVNTQIKIPVMAKLVNTKATAKN